MISCDSNFTETKDFALAIITERVAIKDFASYDLCIRYLAPNLYQLRSKPTKQNRLLF
jgi:hypothetical protein